MNLVLAKNTRLHGLHYQYALQNSPVDEWNPEERLVIIFPGFREVLEARVSECLLHGHRTHLFRDEPRQSFVNCHSQMADALASQADRCGQHQVGSIGLQQISRTNIGIEALGNECDDVHQRFGGLSLFRRQVGDFLQSEDVWYLA
jgi:hypothetical protein